MKRIGKFFRLWLAISTNAHFLNSLTTLEQNNTRQAKFHARGCVFL